MPSELETLLQIMGRLRGPDGCPWDREQTLQTLQGFLLEEAHEVLQALEQGDPSSLEEELGDLLFQIVFQSRIAEELGWFDFQKVAGRIVEKLIRRHPHVFGESTLATAGEVVRQWEELKEKERKRAGDPSRLSGVPRTLPALLCALRLSQKAARAGFDWSTPGNVFVKVREEIQEWEEATHHAGKERAQQELGDLLFSLVNAARKLGLDPEAALHSANQEFRRRFIWMEQALSATGEKAENLSAQRWDELWRKAKLAPPE
jgi:tetrapyrrole methylase family protein/MazG family protein